MLEIVDERDLLARIQLDESSNAGDDDKWSSYTGVKLRIRAN